MMFFHVQKGWEDNRHETFFFSRNYFLPLVQAHDWLALWQASISKCRPTTIGQWSEIAAVINGIQLCIVA